MHLFKTIIILPLFILFCIAHNTSTWTIGSVPVLQKAKLSPMARTSMPHIVAAIRQRSVDTQSIVSVVLSAAACGLVSIETRHQGRVVAQIVGAQVEAIAAMNVTHYTMRMPVDELMSMAVIDAMMVEDFYPHRFMAHNLFLDDAS